ncbi:MAG TPA: AsmA-like C-terminal region-containing protein [Bacteroidota bacterium]
MALTRKSKIWLIVLAIPLVLIIAVAITLKVMFSGDKLKAMVIPRVEQATHRTATIRDMSLTLFPSVGVDMDGFSLANRQGEGFSATPFLTLDRLHVSVKVLPLLKGQVEVTSLELDHPQILIEVNDRNESNYADLTGASDTGKVSRTAQPAAKPKAESALLVNDLRISDGALDYVSYKDNSATRVRGLQVRMGVEAGGTRSLVSGTVGIDSLSYGTVDAPLISGLRLGVDHRLVYDQNADVLTVEKGDIKVQDMTLNLAGTVSGLRSTKVLNLTIGSEDLNIAELLSLVPREYMKKAEGVKGNGTAQVHIAIAGPMADSTLPDVTGKINVSGASIQYPKLPRPISNITIVSQFTRSKTQQEFRIDKLTANLGDNPISMTMTVTNFANPAVTLAANGALNLAEVGQFYPLEPGTELGGRMTADIRVAGKVKEPAAMKGTGTMNFQGVTARTASTKTPVQNLNGTITFNNQVIESKNLAMSMGKSDMRLGFTLKNYLSMLSTDKSAPKATATVALQSNHLYTADLMGEEKAQKPEGKTPAPESAAPAKPGTPGKPGAAPGKGKTNLPLPNVDMDVNAAIGTLTMQKFDFTNVRGAMRISNGVINMQNFSLNAFGGSVTSKGTLNLQNPDKPQFDLGLNLNSLEANALLPHFTSFGQRLSGKMTMTTAMKGGLNDTLGLVPNTLDGNGHVQIQNGTLKGFKVNQSLASMLKLPDLETINFKDWTNAFTIQNGRFQVKDLKITALNAEYLVNGSQGLDGTLEYTMTLYLPASLSSRINVAGFAGEAVNLFKDPKDPQGRLRLDFNVGGTTDDPKLQLNTDVAKERATELAKQKVNEEAKKLGDQAKDKAGDLLKGILKGKKK